MKIFLSPVGLAPQIEVFKEGDVLTINGEVFDFSEIPDGATLPEGAIDPRYFEGGVERVNGILHINLLAPHGEDASEAARFPAPIINPPDGPLDLPQ